MEEGETKICQNCKREIPAANFTIHSVHCTRNVRLCPICKEPVLIAELERHNEKQHKQLPCRQCAENVSASDMEDHIRDSCDFTISSCRFCELDLTRRDMLAHENYCGTRTEQCPDCREWVMLKYRQLHLDSNHGFLRLDDDPTPNNLPNRANFAVNSPTGLFNTRNSNSPLRVLVRNMNQLGEDMVSRMNAQIPGAPNLLGQEYNFMDGIPFLPPPPRRPLYLRSRTFDYAFSPELQRQPWKNPNESQPKIVAGVNDNKNTPSPRGALKKRAAPKPPSGDPSAPTSPTVAKSTPQGAKTSAKQDVPGSSTSSGFTVSAGPPTNQPKPNEPANKSANASEKAKKVNNKVLYDQQRKKSQLESAGPSNIVNQPQGQQPKAKVDNFKSYKPMTTEEFMNRVKELQIGKDSKRSGEASSKGSGEANSKGSGEANSKGSGESNSRGSGEANSKGSGDANSVKEDRFNDIKHSLKELRRELKEVTAPFNNNIITNNNTIENDEDNSMCDLEALALSSSEEEEGAAGGCDSDGDESGEDVRLPCEFCGAPILADDLVQHETGCRPDLTRYSPSRRRSNEPVIPCEFCTQPLPVYLISEHQERCGREAHLLFPD